VLAALPGLRLTVLVGAHAIGWHLGGRRTVAQAVAGWRGHAPAVWPLPHPSWRTGGWMRRNPWVEAELLPALRAALAEVLSDDR
jgi:uracil-DNA glycosylase